MKAQFLTMLCAIAISITSYSQDLQEDQVPAEVKSAFVKKFPKAANAKWELEDAWYEASFRMNGTKTSASFDKSGKWEETETEMKVSEVPVTVVASVNKQYPGYKIKEAEKVESARHGKCYELEIEKDKDAWELLVNAKGEVLKQEAETGEKEEDN